MMCNAAQHTKRSLLIYIFEVEGEEKKISWKLWLDDVGPMDLSRIFSPLRIAPIVSIVILSMRDESTGIDEIKVIYLGTS